jgi:hypothetical protein
MSGFSYFISCNIGDKNKIAQAKTLIYFTLLPVIRLLKLQNYLGDAIFFSKNELKLCKCEAKHT